MTFTGRVTLNAEEINTLIAAEISRRIGFKVDAADVWLGVVKRGEAACEAYVDLKEREIVR